MHPVMILWSSCLLIINSMHDVVMGWHLPNYALYRGGGTGPADPAAAGPIIYSEITTKDDLTT